MTIDEVLTSISIHLHLSKEMEHEILEEIRTHLEDAVAEAVKRGEDEQAALRQAAEQFGIAEAGAQIQEVHANWEAVDAIFITALDRDDAQLAVAPIAPVTVLFKPFRNDELLAAIGAACADFRHGPPAATAMRPP